MTKLQIDYWVRHAIIEEKLDVVRSFTRIEGGTFNQDRMHTHYSQADRFLVAEHGHKLIAARLRAFSSGITVDRPINYGSSSPAAFDCLPISNRSIADGFGENA